MNVTAQWLVAGLNQVGTTGGTLETELAPLCSLHILDSHLVQT
jgi:hypothetical protein